MGEALLWGLVAGSSLILGGLLTLALPIPQRLLGLVMAFGSGILISAVAYELVGEALDTTTGGKGVGLGLAAGTIAFLAGDVMIDRMGGARRKHSGGAQSEGSPLAIVLGIVLDGIPESIVIGLTVLQNQAGVALIGAVFVSNIPEAVAALRASPRQAGSAAISSACGLPSQPSPAYLRSPATRCSTRPRRTRWRSSSPSPAARC